MVHQCRAATRGSQRPLIVGDLPFGTCEVDPKQAFQNSARLVKEGSVSRAESTRLTVQGGVAIKGHVGLTPHNFGALAGFRYQGRNAEQAPRR